MTVKLLVGEAKVVESKDEQGDLTIGIPISTEIKCQGPITEKIERLGWMLKDREKCLKEEKRRLLGVNDELGRVISEMERFPRKKSHFLEVEKGVLLDSQKRQKNLLKEKEGCSKDLRRLEQNVGELREKINRAKRTLAAIKKAGYGYFPDLSFLKKEIDARKTHNAFLPRFGVFSLTEPYFGKGNNRTGDGVIGFINQSGLVVRPLPNVFDAKFSYMTSHLQSFKAKFPGLVPSEVKAEIPRARKIFGDEIYFIAEMSPECFIEGSVVVKKCPFLVGLFKAGVGSYIGEDESELENIFLVKAFNTTSIEKYINAEFVV